MYDCVMISFFTILPKQNTHKKTQKNLLVVMLQQLKEWHIFYKVNGSNDKGYEILTFFFLSGHRTHKDKLHI